MEKLSSHDTKPEKNRGSSPAERDALDNSTTEIANRTDKSCVQRSVTKKLLLKSSRTSLPAAVSVAVNATNSSTSSSNVIAPLKNCGSNAGTRLDDKLGFTVTDTPETTTTSSDESTQLSKDSLSSPISCEHKLLEQNRIINTSSGANQNPAIRRTEKVTHHGPEVNKHLPTDRIIVNRNLKLVSSPASTTDPISTTILARQDASTNTSIDIEGCYDADKKQNKNERTSINVKQKSSKVDKNHTMQYEKTPRMKGNILRNKLTAEKPKSTLGHSMRKKMNGLSTDEQHSTSLGSQVKKVSDKGLDTINMSSNLEDDSTGKDTTTPTPVGQSVDSRIKSIRIKRTISSKVDKHTPCADIVEVNGVITQDLYENNVLNEAPLASPTVPSEKLMASQDLPKLSGDSKSQYFVPLAHSKPISISPNPERRNTRIGSGVLERKSVSDIIGDTQPISGSNLRSFSKTESDPAKISGFPYRCTTPQSCVTAAQNLSQKQKDKGRSKLSNLIFSNKSTKVAPKINLNGTDTQSDSSREDYFTPLFLANASAGKGSTPALDNLLATTQKTITTSNAYIPIYENQTAKILKRIYNLQSSNKWSLRQPRRSVEPIRPKSHWDILIQEALWMRTDFKEERKWKRTVAKNLAYACAEWIFSSQDERKLLQIRTSLSKSVTDNDKNQSNAFKSRFSTIPCEKIVSSRDLEEQNQLNSLETSHVTDIFRLKYNDVIFGLKGSLLTDKLLSELPMYGMPIEVPNPKLQMTDLDPDRFWKRPALPLSKYVEGKMRLKLDSSPRKKSRFEYEEEDDEDNEGLFGGEHIKKSPLPPESTAVALFDPRYRHILDRIRNLNCFRPPSESQMPLQSFFECRTASQWTWDEDKELKGLVREYTYNWSLISSILSSKSKSDLATGAERRTPWECFERWIELEGLPGDMQKTYYFRLYTSRIENANRNIMALQPSQNAQGHIQQARKRSTASVRVERRRSQKYLVLIDTMRKLAKKRETMIQKQQHAASIAALRKSQESPHTANKSLPATTPQDFSRLKYERDEVMKERFLQLQQRQEAQRRVSFFATN